MKFKTITLVMSIMIALSASFIFVNKSYAKPCPVAKSNGVECCCCKHDCSCCKKTCECCQKDCPECNKQEKDK